MVIPLSIFRRGIPPLSAQPIFPLHQHPQGVIGVSENVLRGDCSTIPGNELPLLAQQVLMQYLLSVQGP